MFRFLILQQKSFYQRYLKLFVYFILICSVIIFGKYILEPNYNYIIDGKTRFHKFNFRKQTLLKRYPNSGLTEDMTEYEMTQKLGFYRIWDCGLFKYVWENKS